MVEPIIRKADELDLAAINDIRNYYIVNTTYNLAYEPKTLEETTQWFHEHENKFPFIVAQIDGKVVGWASLWYFRMSPGYRFTAETSVYVHHEYQNHGIGHRLMAVLEKKAIEAQFHCLAAVITDTNLPSIAFHEQCGFKAAGVLNEAGFKDGTFLNIAFMTKII